MRAISPGTTNVGAAPLHFAAADGYQLGGWLYKTTRPPIAVGLMCGGGGVPAKAYRRFATFMAARGIAFLVFDYRGVGASKRQALRGFSARAEDWSELDIAGAVAWLEQAYPSVPVVAVTHSIGAFLFGGSPNAGRVCAACFVSPHTGYFGDYALRFRIPMTVLWHGLMPLLVRMCGYFPGRSLGLGEDIPAGVASQWAARTTPEFRPAGAEAEVRRAITMIERLATLTCPILGVHFSDDAFATAEGAHRLLALYKRTRHNVIRIVPSDIGVRRIGHFGFFRQTSAPVWDRIARQLSASAVSSDMMEG